MSIFKKLKAKHWGNKAIIAIILGTIAAICLTLVIGAYSRIHELENTATAEYRCDEVVFGFNDDETTAKPLGYYVEARYYAENGEMSKEYHYISSAKQSYEAYEKFVNIEQFFGVISLFTGVFTFLFVCSIIEDMILIHKLNKRRDDEKNNKKAA